MTLTAVHCVENTVFKSQKNKPSVHPMACLKISHANTVRAISFT